MNEELKSSKGIIYTILPSQEEWDSMNYKGITLTGFKPASEVSRKTAEKYNTRYYPLTRTLKKRRYTKKY